MLYGISGDRTLGYMKSPYCVVISATYHYSTGDKGDRNMSDDEIAFDFISDGEFRSSVESDYHELTTALEHGMWKAAHVLAGSIIEAILVDHLVTSNFTESDPLKMELGPAIQACRKSGLLTDRIINLSDVVRDYRNLIHPGRGKRLREMPTKETAHIAFSLVGIVVHALVAHRKKSYGLTAEQILEKIDADSLVDLVLKNVVNEANQIEIRRLLLQLIPERCIELFIEVEGIGEIFTDEQAAAFAYGKRRLSSLSNCYRLCFSRASIDVQEESARRAVNTIKEGGGNAIDAYLHYLFRSADMAYLLDDDKDFVKSYILSRVAHGLDSDSLKALEGIGSFIDSNDIESFVDPFVKALTMSRSANYIEAVRGVLRGEYEQMDTHTREAVVGRLFEWSTLYKERNKDDYADVVYKIGSDFSLDLPL